MSETEVLPDRPEMRVEHDSMGDVLVPAHAKYAAQTQRAVENFPISGGRIDRRLVRALALIKGAAAEVNASLRELAAGLDQRNIRTVRGTAWTATAVRRVLARLETKLPA